MAEKLQGLELLYAVASVAEAADGDEELAAEAVRRLFAGEESVEEEAVSSGGFSGTQTQEFAMRRLTEGQPVQSKRNPDYWYDSDTGHRVANPRTGEAGGEKTNQSSAEDRSAAAVAFLTQPSRHYAEINKLHPVRDHDRIQQLRKEYNRAAEAAFDALPGEPVNIRNSPMMDKLTGVHQTAKRLSDGRVVVDDRNLHHGEGVISVRSPGNVKAMAGPRLTPEQEAAIAKGFRVGKEELKRIVSVGIDADGEQAAAVLPGSKHLGGGLVLTPEGGDLKVAARTLRKAGHGYVKPLKSQETLEELYVSSSQPEKRYVINDFDVTGASSADEHESMQPIGRVINDQWSVIYNPFRPAGDGFELVPTAALIRKDEAGRKSLALARSEESDEPLQESRDADADDGSLARTFAGVLNALALAGSASDDLAEELNDEIEESGWTLAKGARGLWLAAKAEDDEDLSEAVQIRTDRRGHRYGYDDQLKKRVSIKGKTASKSRERLRGKTVDHVALSARLQKHAGTQANARQKGDASRAAAALKRHHGEAAAVRVEELAGRLEEVLVGLEGGGEREQKVAQVVRAKLAGLHHTLAALSAGPKPPRQPKAKAEPEHGRTYNVSHADLQVDPARFQYKLNTDSSGVTQELKGVREWNPDFAGVLAVWKDPADGKTYVVNGHHRHELAGRLGAKSLAVRYIKAGSAKEARAIGALINVAEGRGTAVDAAKFMRDSGVGVEDLEKRGVSLKGRVAADAAALTRLSDRQFDKLARGLLEEDKALAVAKHLPDHDLQDQLFGLLDRREEEGKDLSMKVVEEMAREMAETPKTTKTEKSLFGDIESTESLFVPRNEVKAYVRGELAREMGDFLAVASKRRAERVGGAGNVLDVDRNREIAAEAERVKNTFDQLVNSRGTVSDAVNQAAADYAKATSRRERDAAKKRAVEAVREAVRAELGSEVVGGGERGGAGSGGGDAGGLFADAEAADAGRGEVGAAGLSEPAHQEGEKFQGDDGRWFVIKDGKAVLAGAEDEPVAAPTPTATPEPAPSPGGGLFGDTPEPKNPAADLFSGQAYVPKVQTEEEKAVSAIGGKMNAMARAGQDKGELDGFPVERLPGAKNGMWAVTINGKRFEGDQTQVANWIHGAKGAKAEPVAPDVPPADTAPRGDGTRKGRDGTVWAKAPAGGATSPVTGTFYKGGQWMPIHGLSPKQEKTPRGDGRGADAMPPNEEKGGKESGRGGRRGPMSPDEVETEKQRRRTRAIMDGPLGKLTRLNPRTGEPSGGIGWKQWQQFAEEVGEEKLRRIVDALKPTGGYAAMDYEETLNHPQDFKANVPKKHLQNLPSSAEAYAAVKIALEYGQGNESKIHSATADDAERISNILSGFTGTDSLGREWRDGELVAKEDDSTQTPARVEPKPGAHSMQREAAAYLDNVDRVTAKMKRSKGAQAADEGRWLAQTDSALRAAFEKEKRPGELFGDFLHRVAGHSDVFPKQVPFVKDYPEIAKLHNIEPKPVAPKPPVKPQSQDDESWDEYAENADRVSQNPEAASDVDLRRAIGYYSRLRTSAAGNDPELAASHQIEIDHFKGILRDREQAKPKPTPIAPRGTPNPPAPGKVDPAKAREYLSRQPRSVQDLAGLMNIKRDQAQALLLDLETKGVVERDGQKFRMKVAETPKPAAGDVATHELRSRFASPDNRSGPDVFDNRHVGPRWTYGLQNRPPEYANVPRGQILLSDKKHSGFRHGTIDYPFPLTDEEIKQFELTPVASDPVADYARAHGVPGLGVGGSLTSQQRERLTAQMGEAAPRTT